jgi:hypothetical protein
MNKKIAVASLTVALALVTAWCAKELYGRNSMNSHSRQTVPAHAIAFTALQFQATYLGSGAIPVRTETKTFAVRGDGSTAELLHRNDPAGSKKTFYIKKIMHVADKRLVVVEPFGESTTTYPLLDNAIDVFSAKPATDKCDGEPTGELLGHAVWRAESKIGSENTGPVLDEIRTTDWLAPQLGCFPLKREVRFFKNGVEVQHILETSVSLTEGEPESWMFEIPATNLERPPHAAMLEASRRFPNYKALNCGTCDQTPKDEVYFHAQTEHRQQ